jgi:hypothetical protein
MPRRRRPSNTRPSFGDASGQILADQAVGLQINLIEQMELDTASVYIETHAATTNAFGLVNLQIGRGTPVSGDFSMVNWENPTYVQISLDASGGTNYQEMGIAELLSVPYALYAGNAGNSEDADADPTNELQNWGNLPGIPADLLDGDQVDDADADPANEIQTLSQEGSNVTLSNDGGTISVDDADADPTNELEMPQDAQTGDVAFFDGNSWVKVPNGKGGQMLTLNNNGTPYWSGPSTEALLQTTVSNGQIIYVHPTVNNTSLGFNPAMTFTNLTGLDAITYATFSQALANDLDGEDNTEILVNFYGEGSYAAKVCYDLEAFGFDDWYLPSTAEMDAIYRQYSADVGDGTFVGPVRYWTSSISSTSGTPNANSYGFNSSGNINPAQNNGKGQLLCVRK